ncbi:MAG: sigma-70 family RNA polymerase sigma factor [Pseudomonadales bacterium]
MSRSRLEALAYRMLGSVADAEDVLQEARLRRLKLDSPPDNEEAWMVRVVTNLAVDRLREQKRRREAYAGPWLPEPLPTGAPEQVAELAEQLGIGLMLMLERLSPAERAVFVLRDGFDLGFADIGAMLDASAAACRQRYRRARAHLAAEVHEPRVSDTPGEQRALLEALLAAVAERDIEALVGLFAEDCIAYTDGGGVVSAAIVPVTEPARIAQVTLHIAARLEREGRLEFRFTELNGGPGLLVRQDDVLIATLQLEVAAGLIRRLYVVRNPQKLAHLVSP